MGTPTPVTDHAARAEDRLLEQYRGGVLLPGAIRAVAAGMQELEDQAWAVRGARSIDNAVGEQLDVLGRIIGQPREGRTDDVYRIWLRARVRLNRSSGQPEDLVAVFRSITQGQATIVVEEQFPAAIVVKVGYGSIVDPVQLNAVLQAAKAGGVGAVLESATSDDATSFAFDPNGAGFDDGTGTVGGTLAEAF